MTNEVSHAMGAPRNQNQLSNRFNGIMERQSSIIQQIWLIALQRPGDVGIFVFSVCNISVCGFCRQLVQLLLRMRIVRLLLS